ncbi:MAG: hypothetical protein HC934_07195 [Acaryochloridaceae cyanobacterium SU_2_1]|nr:hypothetical protein [Acaryochloridaceae cyanobacterium SU_2_1]
MINFLLLLALVVTQVLGDIWLSRGMKLFGAVSSYSPAALTGLMGYLFTSPWIVLGVITLVVSMLIYLIALTRLDMSFILPIHAFSYVLNALMAALILKEQVSAARWWAAILITLGVLIVGWSKHWEAQNTKQKSTLDNANLPVNSPWLLLVPFSVALPKLWLGVLVLVLADCCADLSVARGIKQIGPFSMRSPRALIQWLQTIFVNPGVLFGVVSYTVSFLMFISLLSWADISLVRPATGLGYIINLCGAHFILKEHISIGRLVGIIMIGSGVCTISLFS